MTPRTCRWGILGAANIARKNWHAIRNSGNGTLAAVASRDPGRAAQFVEDCQSRVPFTHRPQAVSYEELLNSPNIDAVYVPLPTAVRKGWVIRAAEAGKHVVCEKPCGVTAADVAEMLAACREHHVQFMDGVMFMHSRRLADIRSVLQEGSKIGEIRRITSQFSFHGGQEFLDRNIRVHSELEPLGCLGDLGWYNLRLTLCLLNGRRPARVTGRLLRGIERPGSHSVVPLEFSGELLFPDGISASFYCSFVTDLQQWADVSGSRGRLSVRDFVLPYYGSRVEFQVHNDVFAITGCQFNMEEHTRRVEVPEYSNNAPSAQESNLFRSFGDIVLSGRLEPEWGASALLTQEVLDACLASARADGQPVRFS